jgi:hypothetical protein
MTRLGSRIPRPPPRRPVLSRHTHHHARAGYAPGAATTTTYATASERYQGAGAPGGYEERRSVAGLHIPGASTLYSLLGLIFLIGGVLALVIPYKLTGIFFKNPAAYYVSRPSCTRRAACPPPIARRS